MYGFEYVMFWGDVFKIIESGVVDDVINVDNFFKFFLSLKNEKMMGMMIDI